MNKICSMGAVEFVKDWIRSLRGKEELDLDDEEDDEAEDAPTTKTSDEFLQKLVRRSLSPFRFLRKVFSFQNCAYLRNIYRLEKFIERGAFFETLAMLDDFMIRKCVDKFVKDPEEQTMVHTYIYFLILKARVYEENSKVDFAHLVAPSCSFSTEKILSEFCQLLHYLHQVNKFISVFQYFKKFVIDEKITVRRLRLYRDIYLKALKLLCILMVSMYSETDQDNIRVITSKSIIFEDYNQTFLIQLESFISDKDLYIDFIHFQTTFTHKIVQMISDFARNSSKWNSRERAEWLNRTKELLKLLVVEYPLDFEFLNQRIELIRKQIVLERLDIKTSFLRIRRSAFMRIGFVSRYGRTNSEIQKLTQHQKKQSEILASHHQHLEAGNNVLLSLLPDGKHASSQRTSDEVR